MPSFSQKSLQKLSTCHPSLQNICMSAIEIYDFSVLCGYRGEPEQQMLFAQEKSKLHYPHSKHNKTPSCAVDIAPYPIDWENKERFYLLAGIMFGIARERNIKLRWGGDWEMNWQHKSAFIDLPHFELV